MFESAAPCWMCGKVDNVQVTDDGQGTNTSCKVACSTCFGVYAYGPDPRSALTSWGELSLASLARRAYLRSLLDHLERGQ